MRYTREDAMRWVKEKRHELIESLQACNDIPAFMKTPGGRCEEAWCAGCWLNGQLQEAGATEEQIHNIAFAHGQRSVFGDTYKWAVFYMNEFLENGKIPDTPGRELADQINSEFPRFS